MSTFKRFEDIAAWQKSRQLTKEIYGLTSQKEFSRDFALKDQIRRASVSIMSNIAEGFERNGSGEFTRFLAIAKGSAGEVRSQLYVALDQSYITRDIFSTLNLTVTEISKMLAGLMDYLKKSGLKGKVQGANLKLET
ncbi:MAG TPA: four helix bundle protein [Pyrinomonadaceae bacterium]|nr:four helix bundle protein [Pyrinomonadaceae bacterium]